MTKQLRLSVTAAALTAAFATPLAAFAATSTTAQQPVRFTMQTRFYDTRHPGELPGNMALTVYPDGIVSGYYIADDGHPRDVTGGVDGANVWLDIGGSESLHLTGTLKNGVLDATANLPGPDTWIFQSTKVVRQPA